MKQMLNAFTNISFFNDPQEKAVLYKVSVVTDEGTRTKTYTKDKEIKKKVIMPVDTETVEGKTLVKTAVLHTYTDLEFYDTKNASDAVMWKGNLYLIVAEYDRREYGFGYRLEYMNKNEVVIV